MECPGCARELPAGFPGATVECACGARVTHAPSQPSLPLAAGGPYRDAGAAALATDEATCPFCGNACDALARVCPHCDVRLENVRCARCYTLQPPGSFACGRCGRALELEPLLDATDAPCPRCRRPLEATTAGAHAFASPDERVHECPRCGGMFVPGDVLAEILAHAEVSGAFPEVARKSPVLGTVVYVACPLCHTSMNRVNFGKVSGVIVDVCREHGTWFDAGELTRVIAFVASGGRERTRSREEEEKRSEARRSAPVVPPAMHILQDRRASSDGVEFWRAFLRQLFF